MLTHLRLVPPAQLALGALAVLGSLSAVLCAPAARAPSWSQAPERLADTGLYADFEAGTIARDVRAFAPQYPLWTDGAIKRRWIRLPPNSFIDASDVDAWRFPVGTKLWKEFAFERRVETRFMVKRADGSWLRAAYVWNADGSDAVLAPERGLRAAAESAPGVPHDVPGVADCATCHARGDGVLGFSALQLSPDRDPNALHAEAPPPGSIDLTELIENGQVRGLPRELRERAPRIDARSPRERAVLGYLHANCGTCHSDSGLLTPLELHLDARLGPGGEACPTAGPERALASLVGRPSRFHPPGAPTVALRVAAGSPEQSALVARIATRQPTAQMPPLGTRAVDTEALALIEAWVREDLLPRAGTNPTTLSRSETERSR